MKEINTVLPENFGQPDCICLHCRTNRANGSKHIINHGPHKTASQLAKNEVNRASLPGDADYQGCIKPEKVSQAPQAAR